MYSILKANGQQGKIGVLYNPRELQVRVRRIKWVAVSDVTWSILKCFPGCVLQFPCHAYKFLYNQYQRSWRREKHDHNIKIFLQDTKFFFYTSQSKRIGNGLQDTNMASRKNEGKEKIGQFKNNERLYQSLMRAKGNNHR
jgi:hypothetical protein